MGTTEDISDRRVARPDLDAWVDALHAAERKRAERRSGRGAWEIAQWPVAMAVVCAFAALTYTRNGWIPFLSGADLAVHEFGHMVFVWAPTLWYQFAGSFMQVALPLGVCAYFWRWRRDRFAAVVTLAWAAESLDNVSVYIYDATRMVLPLFNDDGSGAGHDWHNILSELGLLSWTDPLAYLVRAGSVVLFLVAFVLALCCLLRALRPV